MTATAAACGPGAAVTTPLIAAAALSALAGWTAHAACARRDLTAARRDPVTGLPGRAGWTAQARRIMRGRGTRTVILVDLDRFKHVNDTYGHAAGDELLAVTAARLRTCAGRVGGSACGLLGGDEFTAVTGRAVTDAETADLAALLARPAALPGSGVTIPVTASVGAAACAGRRGLSAVLAAADAAMYRAKHSGGCYRIGIPADPVPAPGARTRHHGPQSFAVVQACVARFRAWCQAGPVAPGPRRSPAPGAVSRIWPGRRAYQGRSSWPGLAPGLRHLARSATAEARTKEITGCPR
jgi:diguanylate cyclase